MPLKALQAMPDGSLQVVPLALVSLIVFCKFTSCFNKLNYAIPIKYNKYSTHFVRFYIAQLGVIAKKWGPKSSFKYLNKFQTLSCWSLQ